MSPSKARHQVELLERKEFWPEAGMRRKDVSQTTHCAKSVVPVKKGGCESRSGFTEWIVAVAAVVAVKLAISYDLAI